MRDDEPMASKVSSGNALKHSRSGVPESSDMLENLASTVNMRSFNKESGRESIEISEF